MKKKNKNIKLIIILLLIVIIISFIVFYNLSNKFKITKNEVSQISYEKYDDGLLSMIIPTGWKIESTTSNLDSYLYYTYTAYKPENSNYRIFVNLKTEGYPLAKEQKEFFESFGYRGNFTDLPIINPMTVDTFYKNFNSTMEYYIGDTINVPKINDFTIIETIGANITGGDILRATYKDENNNLVDGIFTATIESSLLNNIGTISIFNTVFITTPENELTEWVNVLTNCISTIKFSDKFVTNFKEATSKIKSNVLRNEDKYENILDYGTTCKIINESWKSRKSTYDIENQKKLDETLGYKRVYNIKNGNIYKVKNGFIKHIKKNKYKTITDEMYNLPTSGIIEE